MGQECPGSGMPTVVSHWLGEAWADCGLCECYSGIWHATARSCQLSSFHEPNFVLKGDVSGVLLWLSMVLESPSLLYSRFHIWNLCLIFFTLLVLLVLFQKSSFFFTNTYLLLKCYYICLYIILYSLEIPMLMKFTVYLGKQMKQAILYIKCSCK